MKTITLTKDEQEVFKRIYEENDLWEYLSYTESGKLAKDAYSTLFSKLGINLAEVSDLDLGGYRCK